MFFISLIFVGKSSSKFWQLSTLFDFFLLALEHTTQCSFGKISNAHIIKRAMCMNEPEHHTS